eukprot:jgi/Botrbrau1/1080/Bobra.0076s0044.1
MPSLPISLSSRVSSSNNRFRSSSGGRVSVRATGRVYSALSAASSLASLSSASTSAISSVKDTVDEALKGASSSRGLSSPADADVLESTTLMVLGIAALDAPADAFKVAKLAEFLVACKKAVSVADAFHVVAGIKTLPSIGPVAITLLTPALKIKGKGELKVQVTDFEGNPLNLDNVALTAGKGNDAVYTDKPFKPSGEPGVYVANFFSKQQPFGTYNVVVTAGSAGGSPGGSLEFRLMVTEELEVPDVEVAHYEDGNMRSTISLSNLEPLPPSITSLSAKGSLKVATRVLVGNDILVPQQIGLTATSLKSGLTAYIPAYVSKESPADFMMELSPATITQQIGPQGGDFLVKLVIGDDAEAAPVEWSLGTLAVAQLPGTSAGPRGAYAAAQPKVEIRHIFRPPAKQPPVLVSLAFTVLSLLPLPAALFMAFYVGGNFKNFPTSPSLSIPVVAFHGGIAAILLLSVAFWVNLSLLQTLPLLGVAGLFTILSGHRALSGLAELRINSEIAKIK